jgi:NhaP-type Na+/H+ or K+/H+ antiporter
MRLVIQKKIALLLVCGVAGVVMLQILKIGQPPINWNARGVWLDLATGFLFSFLIGISFGILLAMPTFWLFEKFCINRWWRYPLAGIITSALIPVIMFLYSNFSSSQIILQTSFAGSKFILFSICWGLIWGAVYAFIDKRIITPAFRAYVRD